MEQKITIKIANRLFMLKVSSPEHEALMRKSANEINEQVKDWQKKNPTQAASDIVCLVALKLGMLNIGLADKIRRAEHDVEELSNEVGDYLDMNE